MRTAALFVVVLLLLVACSCRRKPGRPNTELCLWLSESQTWECEDAFEHVRVETNPGNLMCTTIAGYNTLEQYVDAKEKKVRELERQLAQCRGN
jgi:hypothetical protein